MKINVNNTFNLELPADKNRENDRRQVLEACFSYVNPKKTKAPELIHVSDEMLNELGISKEDSLSTNFIEIFTGNKVYPESKPYAMCYGGHQFGNWAGQLGDGRAINLFEINHNDKQWAVQLKGAGETPYSRSADGLAVLRSSIREYLCSEAMHHLGVPTTRALSLCQSGDQVLRDILYNGNPAYEKGAIVCRVAPSFIRFGNFEIQSARKNHILLKKLTDYTIKHFFPKITITGKDKYLEFFKVVCNKTIDMIIHWQRVGFVHGVMNTDNMSILGLTIDYGPYGWLEGYDHTWTPNTTDAQQRRYRFGNQMYIGLWNLFKLANAIYPLIEETKSLQNILDSYNDLYEERYVNMMRKKLGFEMALEEDNKIINKLEIALQLIETDMTIFFRNLGLVNKEFKASEAIEIIKDAFYSFTDFKNQVKQEWIAWLELYLKRLKKEEISNKRKLQNMNLVNPKYVFRNYMAQLAIDRAEVGDYQLIEEFYMMLKKPYNEQPEFQKWFSKRPDWARNKVGCSMLSCSS